MMSNSNISNIYTLLIRYFNILKKLIISHKIISIFVASSIVLYLIFIPAEQILDDISFSTQYYSENNAHNQNNNIYGKLLRATLSDDDQYRFFAPIKEYPSQLLEIIRIYEDQWFYMHGGINPITLLNSFYQTYIIKNRKIGGSTITMQLARMKFHINSSTIKGKIIQIFLSIYLELYYSKQEIFETYLNLVPMGGNISGYHTASIIYFDKPIYDLSLAEMLTLVALPQNPNARRPTKVYVPEELSLAKERIFDLYAKKYSKYKNKKDTILAPIYISHSLPFYAPHFIEYIQSQELPINTKTPVLTTIRLPIQKKIEAISKRYISQHKNKGINNTSILLLNYNTMKIEAMLGSVDYFDDSISGQVNGTTAKRSPGSTLKPFIFALALQQGLIHEKTILKDSPTSFNEYTPDNFKNEYSGVIDASHALVYSRNIPAVHLATQLKNPDLYNYLVQNKVKLEYNKEHYGQSIVLGGAELSGIELVRLYASLANKGYFQDIRIINNEYKSVLHKIVQEKFTPSSIKESAAFIVLEMLYTNPHPNGEEAKYHDVAYKTGTSIGFRDAWSIAIFDTYVLAVWIGNFDGSSNPLFQGRSAAAPLLFSLISTIREFDREKNINSKRHFEVPSQVKKVEICKASGMLMDNLCPISTLAWFIPGISPIKTSNLHEMVYLNKEGLRVEKDDPNAIRSKLYEIWPSDIMKLFQKTGLPRNTPPPYADEYTQFKNAGIAPRIVSPNQALEYILSLNNTDFNVIPLKASAENGVHTLHWFADNTLLGTSKPDEILEVQIHTSFSIIKVVDDKGRSDQKPLNISFIQ